MMLAVFKRKCFISLARTQKSCGNHFTSNRQHQTIDKILRERKPKHIVESNRFLSNLMIFREKAEKFNV